ncbi:MAG: hypothetical protein FWF95_05150 [Syntrophorhabdaceae bacterium]|nr:hypothetical protein [Syntrophorhabdaceae bacterium]
MKNLRTAKALAAFLTTAAFFAACGGAGVEVAGTTTTMKTSCMISWNAPETKVNNETINPYNDLYQYELYVSSTPNFSDTDTPVAFVSAVENGESGARKLVTEFDLALLNIDNASSTLYVSLRAVGVDGQKSDFMAPVTWTRS